MTFHLADDVTQVLGWALDADASQAAECRRDERAAESTPEVLLIVPHNEVRSAISSDVHGSTTDSPAHRARHQRVVACAPRHGQGARADRHHLRAGAGAAHRRRRAGAVAHGRPRRAARRRPAFGDVDDRRARVRRARRSPARHVRSSLDPPRRHRRRARPARSHARAAMAKAEELFGKLTAPSNRSWHACWNGCSTKPSRCSP